MQSAGEGNRRRNQNDEKLISNMDGKPPRKITINERINLEEFPQFRRRENYKLNIFK